MDREEFDFYRVVSITVLLLIILSIAGTFMWYSATPALKDMETEGIRHSQQYITTKQTLLLDLVRDYEEIEVSLVTIKDPTIIQAKKSQQKAILRRIEHEASLLETQYVPMEVKQLLARKGN